MCCILIWEAKFLTVSLPKFKIFFEIIYDFKLYPSIMGLCLFILLSCMSKLTYFIKGERLNVAGTSKFSNLWANSYEQSS